MLSSIGFAQINKSIIFGGIYINNWTHRRLYLLQNVSIYRELVHARRMTLLQYYK